jgi:hypothetical protein
MSDEIRRGLQSGFAHGTTRVATHPSPLAITNPEFTWVDEVS